HNVHQPDAANPQRQGADESEQDFQGGSHYAKVVKIFLEVGNEDGAAVIGTEIVMSGKNRTHNAGQLLVILAFVIHEHPGNVLGIVEVAHGGKGDDNHAVVVIVAALHFMLINTHDLEAHSVDANALAFGLFTGEQASFCFVANHRHPCMFDLVRLAQGASSSDVKTT